MANMPKSRTVTLIDGDPLPPAVINELEDMIVGSKYTNTWLLISAADFKLVTGAGTCTDGFWTFSGVPAKLVASVPVEFVVDPSGASATAATVDLTDWFFNRGGAGSLVFKLRGRNIDTGAAAFDIGVKTVAAGAGQNQVGFGDPAIGGVAPDSGIGLPYTPQELSLGTTSMFVEVLADNVAQTFAGMMVRSHRF